MSPQNFSQCPLTCRVSAGTMQRAAGRQRYGMGLHTLCWAISTQRMAPLMPMTGEAQFCTATGSAGASSAGHACLAHTRVCRLFSVVRSCCSADGSRECTLTMLAGCNVTLLCQPAS